MAIEVKVPLLPESISDATVSTWHKKVGDQVSRDENIVDLETDKVMLEVPAPADGVIKEIRYQNGSTVHAQEVLAVIEAAEKESAAPKEAAKPAVKEEVKPTVKEEAKPTQAPQQAPQQVRGDRGEVRDGEVRAGGPALSPSARRAIAEHGMDITQMTEKSGRITKENVMAAVSRQTMGESTETISDGGARLEKRVPMSRLRARIAERLLEVTQNTAMLTTFNEINMSKVMEIRSRYREKFEKKYNVRLGFMSFFVRACVEALKQSPIVNASIDGNDIVYHGYYDIGVAVSTDRGLVVPVLRNADQLSMAEIEAKIAEAAEKARTGKLTLEEMQGGTFTITNGGVFGSLMATPLLNSPQSAILGMHKIEERPIAEEGQVVIKPMMYVALSYDHRIIDGKESVSFLVAVKEFLEDPARIILEV